MFTSCQLCLAVIFTISTAQQVPAIGPDADPLDVKKHADQLVRENRYEEALAEYLWCFDEGAKQDPAFTGVRVSFLLSDIENLGKKYPPALDALRQRRDAVLERMATTKGTNRYLSDMMDLAALNRRVGDDGANLQLYDEIKKDDPDSPVLPFLMHHIEDELVEAGREDELQTIRQRGIPGRAMPTKIERAFPRNAPMDRTSVRSPYSSTAYALDVARFERELAAAHDETSKLSAYERRWNDVVLAATYCKVVTDRSFHQSVQRWQSGWLRSGTWTVNTPGDLDTSHNDLSKATAQIKGDCDADITIVDGGMVHLYGNLDATITISGHSEIVIGGDITTEGGIVADGILQVFVGGHVDGQIVNRGSTTILGQRRPHRNHTGR